jgi:hypothetical protein
MYRIQKGSDEMYETNIEWYTNTVTFGQLLRLLAV